MAKPPYCISFEYTRNGVQMYVVKRWSDSKFFGVNLGTYVPMSNGTTGTDSHNFLDAAFPTYDEAEAWLKWYIKRRANPGPGREFFFDASGNAVTDLADPTPEDSSRRPHVEIPPLT